MVIGLTGHSGSGKTTAAKIFEDCGFLHIDCDKMVHTEIYTDTAVVEKIAQTFGEHTVCNNTIDRRALAKIIFGDKTEYDKLMTLLKPYITDTLSKKITQADCVLVDAPMLFEFDLKHLCDVTVGVVSNNAVERITARDGISVSDAKSRLANQKSPEFYAKKCDYVIENNGTLSELTCAVTTLVNKLMKGLCN